MIQLLENFRETLYKIIEKEPAKVEEEKVILRSLLKQNLIAIKKALLERELHRDACYCNICFKSEVNL